MIDEELYKKATDELNSDARKPDVWARACALAADDHDEARFLYTNLRVEEMMNTDGKQRTFSAEKHRQNLAQAEKLDTLELDTATDTTHTESSRTGVDSTSAPLPIDDILGLDEGDATIRSESGNPALGTMASLVTEEDTLADLENLSLSNKDNDTVLSGITGEAVQNGDSASDDQSSLSLSDADIVEIGSARRPEEKRTIALTAELQDQADDIDRLGDAALSTNDNAEFDSTEELQLNDTVETVRTDYADSEILQDDLALASDQDLQSGSGKSFAVFSKNGSFKAIKNGVSWPALFFTFPWLLTKGLLGTALVYACVWLISLAGLYVTASQWMQAGSQAGLDIRLWTAAFALLALVGLLLIPFLLGNKWVAKKMQNRGFEMASFVRARSKNKAVERLLDASSG